jgi:POT family proton-dependent oligopeptide transporter
VPFVLKADPTKFDPEFIAQVQQVLNVCKVFTLFPVYWLLYNQMSSNFITQAQWMSRPSWLNEEQLNLVDPLVIIFMIPVVNFILPIIRRRFGLKLGSLTRIATGFVIAAFGFLYVGFLQLDIQRRGTWVGPDSEYILKSGVSEEITIWYQTVPYFFIGVSEIFSAISALEFAYSKAPSNMKAIVMALFLLSNAFGSILGLILAPIFVPKNFTFIFFAFSGGMLLLALIFFWKFKDSDYEKVEAPSHQVFTVAFSDKELES